MENLLSFAVLSLACASISLVVTTSSLIEPFREWVRPWRPVGFRYWFFSLITCPFCFSFWVSLFLSLYFQPFLFNAGGFVENIIVTMFAMMSLSGVIWTIILSGSRH